MTGFRLGDIVADLGGELIGDADQRIGRIGPLEGATPDTLTFIANARYRPQLAATRAACVIAAPALRDEALARAAVICVEDPYLHFAKLTQWWATRTRARPVAGIHPTAVIDASVTVGANVSIGPFVVIEAGVVVDDDTVIGAHCHIGADSVLGPRTQLEARVTIGSATRIGERALIHSGAVIGADGFGFAPTQGRWEKIEQLGGVLIGDDVEVGANTCIDRGALGDTVIGNGVKLDNLIQIGHNVRIGDHTAIAGMAGVAGSAVIGRRCTIGGAARILGHLTLGDDVHISVASVVLRSIAKPGHYSGIFPIDDNAAWEKTAATLRQLHTLRARLMSLERAIDKNTT
ncbi:MAG TPA: UDP-3-O-(3-hydroxymyristoyl)glucosamine N-acyltransferase [Rubrivivax sp.]|nr:UDP-3-O-(3-hydroxymyristoyl)glucosamine N-acyltransferase [Rubrivivax sp.]